ncbi:MAG: class I SAM-dependent rRNA methyltransferase [Parachlamydiales bacterium]|nr:class I SAM-dependent rRNA methyltransferase [Parachlamydiales bacterium]
MKKTSVILKKDREHIFSRKHHWIFSNAIQSFPDNFENGKIYPIASFDKKLLGYGYFNRKCSLCGRIVSFDKKDPMESIFYQIKSCYDLRKDHFDFQKTNAFRLINAEGDFLPGLIVDYFDNNLVIQIHTLGMEVIKDEIIDYLISIGNIRSVFEKSKGRYRQMEGLDDCVKTHYGEKSEEIVALENGYKFIIPWEKGQKTGFFTDQREMRKYLANFCKDQSVLNCFSYSGSFSLYALKNNAKKVTSVDSSSFALDVHKRVLELNSCESEKIDLVEEDVFRFLENCDKLDYQIVILDPPAFAKSQKDIFSAANAYQHLNFLALKKMPPKSFLLTSSCSYYIDEETFQKAIFLASLKANRSIKILQRHRLGIDHPVNLHHKESSYLKSFFLFVQ